MSTESLNWIISSMKANFGFDAVQILWFCPENHKYYEIFREGYNQSCADSLNYDFPITYPQGFTQVISPNELLPPSISESGEIMQPPFRMTNIYAKHLNKNGYYDGLSLELNSSGVYFGLIHFSSFKENNFNKNVRSLINNFRGVVESWMHKIISYRETLNHYVFFSTKEKNVQHFELIQVAQDSIKNELILKVIESFHQSKKFMIVHERNVYKVSVTGFPNGNNMVEIYPSIIPNELSKKELIVLSYLASGKTDKEIAQLLCLGERTIHSHISSILRKLRVGNRVEAAVYAVVNEMIAFNTASVGPQRIT